MKKTFLILICFTVFLGLTSEKKQTILFDWTKITDRNCYVKIAKPVYDESNQAAIDQKIRRLTADSNAVLLSKKATKLLQQLLLDPGNFKNQTTDPSCKTPRFTKAFIVFTHNKESGIINIACDGEFWDFDPLLGDMQSGTITPKGQALKNELFRNINFNK